MKLLKTLSIFLLAAVAVYGAAVFTTLEPNVFLWSEHGRFFFVATSVVGGWVASIFAGMVK